MKKSAELQDRTKRFALRVLGLIDELTAIFTSGPTISITTSTIKP
jgi:hypothetical protein